MKKSLAIALALAFAFGYAGMAAAGDAANGESLWASKKCKNCHNLDSKKKVGPGLAGISKKRSAEWLTKWLLDPDGTFASDDAETAAMKKDNGVENAKKTKMKIAKLSEGEVADLMAYMMANGG